MDQKSKVQIGAAGAIPVRRESFLTEGRENMDQCKIHSLPKKLKLLADWFDREQQFGRWGGEKGSHEVQDNLRRWADEVKQLHDDNARLRGKVKELRK